MENVVIHLCHITTEEEREEIVEEEEEKVREEGSVWEAGGVTPVEGWEAIHHLIRDHSQTPPVYSTTIVLFPEDFRG